MRASASGDTPPVVECPRCMMPGWCQEGFERSSVQAPAPPAPQRREGPVRILVVAASEPLRERTVRTLQTGGGPGWEPDAVATPGAARTKLLREPWDAVLLRLDAEPFDPAPVLDAVRRAPWWPPTAVVAVVAPAAPPLPGAVTVLAAPCPPTELVASLRDAVGRPPQPPPGDV